MSLIEPPDPDDLFAAIVAGVEEVEVEEIYYIDYSKFPVLELMDMASEVQEELQRVEPNILFPVTPEGRDLHSRLVAINFHIKQHRKRKNP